MKTIKQQIGRDNSPPIGNLPEIFSNIKQINYETVITIINN